VAAAEVHAELIKSETLSVEFDLTVGAPESAVTVGDDLPVSIQVSKS
jgi:hypothetical protein